jgi:hypothetical protein
MAKKTFLTPEWFEYESSSDSGCQGGELNEFRCESEAGDELSTFHYNGRYYQLCSVCYEAWCDEAN